MSGDFWLSVHILKWDTEELIGNFKYLKWGLLIVVLTNLPGLFVVQLQCQYL